ncbi:hypothetical protein BGZ72_006225 [Mortierella alpina]|nr:hypothetical protein BGZ72_006225 [Mortierella alpina]
MSTHDVTHEGVHLLVLSHGLWGNVAHVRFIAEQFKQRLGDRILVYRAQANESALTYDGIDICGQRLVQEISSVIRVIEAGGNIEEMKGQNPKKKKVFSTNNLSRTTAAVPNTTTKSNEPALDPALQSTATNADTTRRSGELSENVAASTSDIQKKRVTQLSYLGYSLGGLIGRFAIGMLDLDGFFDPVERGGRGIEPMYFVTMATPHLGIRSPSLSRWSKIFNYLSARMLSRTGEQLQLVDDYIRGRPLLLVLSDPSSVFLHALARFKRRVLYCNIRNDRTVPFWTASFSDADPFRELGSLQIQYNPGYSSLIESFEHQDLEALERQEQERRDALKAASLRQRIAQRLMAIPWKKYVLYGTLGPVLIPLWLLFACSTISVQGLNSRRRTKPMMRSNKILERMRDENVIIRTTVVPQHRRLSRSSGSSTGVSKHPMHNSSVTVGQEDRDDVDGRNAASSSITLAVPAESTRRIKRTVSSSSDTSSIVETINNDDEDEEEAEQAEPTSLSYPHLKKVRPLALLPVQLEISRNLNRLEWRKNIVHIEAFNAHASIVVREKRFSNDGGVAAVQHAVDMFKEDGEDE